MKTHVRKSLVYLAVAYAPRRRKQATQCLALVLSIVSLGVCTLEAGTIVVPPALENVEGNTAYLMMPQPTGFRVQHAYPASDFAQMAPSPGVLVQMAVRPDRSITAPRTAVWHDFELRLSTTDSGPGSLSSVFNNNFGDDMTVVSAGDLTTSTQGTGPPNGPRSFDYVIDFQQPFVYDPSGGNLLVDFRCSSIDGLPFFDANVYGDGLTRMLFAPSPSASVATFTDNGVGVLAFSVVPGPVLLGDVNFDGRVDGLDVDPFVHVLLDGPYLAEADMNDDQVVNGLDVDPFVAAVLGGDTHKIPEPLTLLLLCTGAVGLLAYGICRRE